MLKQLLITICLCLVLPFTGFTQEKTESAGTARLIDEFGQILVSELIARLDNLVAQLQNQPNAKLFLLHHRSRLEPPGSSSRFLNGMKNYMVKSRGVAPETIILVDAGALNCRTTQLWVAPAGTAPKSTINAYDTTFDDTESARKFDEYYFDSDSDFIDIENGYGFGTVDSLEAFTAAVKKQSNALAYVILYPEYYIQKIEQTSYKTNANGETDYDSSVTKVIRRQFLDSPAKAARLMRQIRNKLVVEHKLAVSKIRIVNGGYRRLRQVELWILPRGEHPPIATPNAFPKLKNQQNRRNG